MSPLVWVCLVFVFQGTWAKNQAPHIVTILLDDLGVTNVGFNAKIFAENLAPGTLFFEAQNANFTPNIDALAAQGIILTKHYAYSSCTSSRMSFLSGRFPVHVGVELGEPSTWDGGVNNVSGYEGLSPNTTTIVAKMKENGYKTHHVGKADGFGMATPQHIPVGRGFDSSLAYYNHANDFFSYRASLAANGAVPPCIGVIPNGGNVQDFWYNSDAGNVSPYYNCDENGTNCVYMEKVLTDRVVDIIQAHPKKDPLFLMYAAHIPHTPLQVPQEYLADIQALCAWANSTYPLQCVVQERQLLLAMMKYMDDMVGRIVAALRAKGMWDNTLLVFLSDNGGGTGIGTGGNVFPLRGGKGSSFEGGFRVPAFVSGGVVPGARRGTRYEERVRVSDWYATFCSLAGGRVCTGAGADPTGDAVGLWPVESVNLWPYLIRPKSRDIPHSTLHLSPSALIMTVNNIPYKLITGVTGYNLLTSPNYPNCTSGDTCGDYCCESGQRPLNPAPIGPPPLSLDCGLGCLFDLSVDETESNNICASMPSVCNLLISTLATLNQTYYEPWRGCEFDGFVCNVYKEQWNYTFGPFLNVADCPTCLHLTPQYLLNPRFPRSSNFCQCYQAQIRCLAEGSGLCAWIGDSCDLRPEYAGFTPAQISALRRSNSTIFNNRASFL